MTMHAKKTRTLRNRRTAMKGARRVARILFNRQVAKMRRLGFRPVSEAARKVGLSVPRIYQLLNKGKLAGTREGTTRRYVKWLSLRARFPHAFQIAKRS